jgi:hypothetical protein
LPKVRQQGDHEDFRHNPYPTTSQPFPLALFDLILGKQKLLHQPKNMWVKRWHSQSNSSLSPMTFTSNSTLLQLFSVSYDLHHKFDSAPTLFCLLWPSPQIRLCSIFNALRHVCALSCISCRSLFLPTRYAKLLYIMWPNCSNIPKRVNLARMPLNVQIVMHNYSSLQQQCKLCTSWTQATMYRFYHLHALSVSLCRSCWV